MLARTTLTTIRAAAGTGLLLIFFNGCHHPVATPTRTASSSPPKVKFNPAYDAEIKEIMDLARKEHWEEAQVKADLLFQKAPQNPMVQRIHSWVAELRQKRREQSLEDKIREIEAKDSVFNPTLPGLFREQKDRGLPATKDVRDAVQRIENSPYIPESYGKTIHRPEPLFDLESTKGRMSKVLEKEVSIHLDNVPLETILMTLSQTTGVNIVADKSLPALKQL